MKKYARGVFGKEKAFSVIMSPEITRGAARRGEG